METKIDSRPGLLWLWAMVTDLPTPKIFAMYKKMNIKVYYPFEFDTCLEKMAQGSSNMAAYNIYIKMYPMSSQNYFFPS